MKMRLSILVLSCLAATLSASLVIGPQALTASELAHSRGGSAFQTKCMQSCNAFNTYNDDCVDGETQICKSCTKPTEIVNYVDMPPVCGTGGYERSKTAKTDCGGKNIGLCSNYQCKEQMPWGDDQCYDAPKVVAQGSGGN